VKGVAEGVALMTDAPKRLPLPHKYEGHVTVVIGKVILSEIFERYPFDLFMASEDNGTGDDRAFIHV
jgi:hypothetical protein